MSPRTRHLSEHPTADRPWSVETAGIESVADDDRHGTASELFWVWLGANIGIVGMIYGAVLTTLGLNLWQGAAAAVVGTVLSFVVVGVLGVAGKWGGRPDARAVPHTVRAQGQPCTSLRELDQPARLGDADGSHRRVRGPRTARHGHCSPSRWPSESLPRAASATCSAARSAPACTQSSAGTCSADARSSSLSVRPVRMRP